MPIKLKPIGEQVIVITGASSGIGLVTARLAARRGAAVVLTARNETDLANAVSAIRAEGGRAVAQPADVTDPQQVTRVAEEAVRQFGRIDTWINNAGVGLYGRITEVSLDDMRRQFEVNYWGPVYGSLTAIPYLTNGDRDSGRYGAALINIASALADRAIPLQGNYCASKHALKAFTDTLRMELKQAGAAISVTLIKPSSMDTPLFEKSKTYLGFEPQPVPPVYDPEVSAQAILAAAVRPVRDVIAGGRGKVLSLLARAPRFADRYMERTLFDAQQSAEPARQRDSNLYAPVQDDGGERGRNWKGRTKKTSLYTRAVLSPRKALAAAVAVGVVFAKGVRRVKS